MIEKIRKKFIKITMIAVVSVFMVITLSINGLFTYKTISDLNAVTQIIVDSGGHLRKNKTDINHFKEENPDFHQNIKPNVNKELFKNKEMPFATRYFFAVYDENNNLTEINLDYIASVEQNDAEKISDTLIKKGISTGWNNGMRYRVAKTENGYMVVVMDADRFGLSQLYQIRGRVGRSNKIGYAYLMYNKGKMLTDTAVKRLDTIKEFTELGSGFKIAMRDLSIRGAGDILGREQSGFIDSVGIDLYLKMLNDAINKSKGIESNDDTDTSNEKPLISVPTYIDDNYVSDGELKISIHKMINRVNSYDSFCKIKAELEDRFGKLNDDMINYMYEEWFEKIAKSLNIEEVNDGKNSVDMTLPKEVSSKLSGDVLFMESYNISKMFRFSYKNEKIHVILDKINLDKHYLMYLIAILIKIKELISN